MDKKEHLLICLAEECAEVSQAVSKALRFGLDYGYPDTNRTNKSDIQKEIIDVIAVAQMLMSEGILDPIDLVHSGIVEKQEKVKRYMEHAKITGALNDL